MTWNFWPGGGGSEAPGYLINVGGIAFTSGTQSGNSFNNFAKSLQRGNSVVNAGFSWIQAGADRTLLVDIASTDWAVKIASIIAYTAVTVGGYIPLIDGFCHPTESNGQPMTDASGNSVQRCH